MLTEVLLPGALPNIVTGIRTGLGFAWRGLIAAEMIATNVGLGYMLFVARDFYRTEVIVLGHDRDRSTLAADRSPAAGSARTFDHRALGHGEARMNILLRSWSLYTASTQRWPGLAAIVPFIPVIALWIAVAEFGIFPRAFFPGPVEVVKAFFTPHL